MHRKWSRFVAVQLTNTENGMIRFASIYYLIFSMMSVGEEKTLPYSCLPKLMCRIFCRLWKLGIQISVNVWKMCVELVHC